MGEGGGVRERGGGGLQRKRGVRDGAGWGGEIHICKTFITVGKTLLINKSLFK